MKFHFQRAGEERGYVLLVLLLMVALLSIGLLAMGRTLTSQIKRDREEELIHRGVQYSRAVRRFCLRFKRYPASVEELESTNNIRFLRKRYKDPITGKDFKPLHLTEVAALQPVAPLASAPPPPTAEPEAPVVQAPQVIKRESDGGVFPADTQSAKGEQSGSASAGSNGTDAPAVAASPNPDDDPTYGAPPLQGVPIVGVVSLSKEKSIREFDKKDHYNQWFFIYDPRSNPLNGTVPLISTPYQPPLLSQARADESQNKDSTRDAGVNMERPDGSLTLSTIRQ